MEEKERYTIENFEIEEPPVIFDNKTQQIILTLVDYNYDEITHLKDLLNYYFKRIKELGKENQQLKQAQNQLAIEQLKDLRDKICDIGYDEDYNTDYFEVMKELDNQIKQLKEKNNDRII